MHIRRLVPVVALLLAIAASPASGDVTSRKQEIDSRLQAVQAKIARAEQRERELAADIASVMSLRSSRLSSATWRCTRRSSTG